MSARRTTVALRKESVDRNTAFFSVAMAVSRSLSARRAWIEIPCFWEAHHEIKGRSPQGERG